MYLVNRSPSPILIYLLFPILCECFFPLLVTSIQKNYDYRFGGNRFSLIRVTFVAD
jgi:hypothetical protein